MSLKESDLLEYFGNILENYPFTKDTVNNIFNLGWRAYILPKTIFYSNIGGRIIPNANDGNKYILIRGYGKAARQMMFHELLHIYLDSDNDLCDPRSKKLAREVLSLGLGHLLHNTYEQDIISKNAKVLEKTSSDYLDDFFHLHSKDIDRQNSPFLKIHPETFFANVEYYKDDPLIACYYGSLDSRITKGIDHIPIIKDRFFNKFELRIEI